jgi:hypothetical protein
MEKTFLKIARNALIGVIALSLVLTVIAVVFGAFEFLPSSQPKAPKITIKLKDMTKPKAAAAIGSEGTPSGTQPSEDEIGVTKQCVSVIPKMNSVAKQIGWEKKSEQSFNSSKMQFETKSKVDYDESINTNRFCKLTKSFIAEQDSKLEPFIKQIDLQNSYYEELNGFMDELAADSNRNKALQPDDAGRFYFGASLVWFNGQFSQAVDEARESASLNEMKKAAARARGRAALYAAGTSFGFFFACCLILVFMRIEVDARELVDAVRALDHKEPSTPSV